jgi:hypothetical protein
VRSLSEQPINCPYCGEPISVVVDHSIGEQEYIEDCQVCCRPLVLNISIDEDGEASVIARYENE